MIDIILFRICLWITYKALTTYKVHGCPFRLHWISLKSISVLSIKVIGLTSFCSRYVYQESTKYTSRYIGSGFHAFSMIVTDMSDTRWPGPLKWALTSFSRLGPVLHCGTLGKSFAPQICVWPGPWKTPNWSTVSEAFELFLLLTPKVLLHLYATFNIMPFAIS